jgi:hypothetical protein
MKVHVEVKQEHIDAGKRSDCFHCPVAIAIQEATGKPWRVQFRKMWTETELISVPEKAKRFIYDFDHGLKPQPFAFDVELP